MRGENRSVSEAQQGSRVLKVDGFGSVERVEAPGGPQVVRRASGSRAPGSRLVARLLLGRERRALEALAGLEGVPSLSPEPTARGELWRSWIEGEPLWAARVLPGDYFERLEDLVAALHARGVCHNDLHKEQNVLVGADGYPALIDFQLASVHPRGGWLFRSRCAEDRRHVEKHRALYLAHRPGAGGASSAGRPRRRRSAIAWAWLRLGKPVYHLVTRRLLGWQKSEPVRPEEGPWPTWTAPLGPRAEAGPEHP